MVAGTRGSARPGDASSRPGPTNRAGYRWPETIGLVTVSAVRAARIRRIVARDCSATALGLSRLGM